MNFFNLIAFFFNPIFKSHQFQIQSEVRLLSTYNLETVYRLLSYSLLIQLSKYVLCANYMKSYCD